MARITTFLPATPSLWPRASCQNDRCRSTHEQLGASSLRSILFIELYGLEPLPRGIDGAYSRWPVDNSK